MKYTKEYLTTLVENSKCMWEVIEKTGMGKQQGNYRYIANLVKKYQISKVHFDNQMKFSKKRKPLSDYLVKDKFLTTSGNILKKKLYEAGLKKKKCELCGQDENWKGTKISLILDHVDGNRDNNELINLRIVCPNCNAGLDTHCGKNRKTNKPIINYKKIRDNKLLIQEQNKIKQNNKILNSNIDFTKYGWGVQLGKFLNCSPQYALKYVKENLDGFYKEKCFKS